MNDTQHTPGPWKIGTPGPNGCYTIGTEKGGLMTAIIAHSIREPKEEQEAKANARLVAAAPDMLEALELYLKSEGNTDWARKKRSIRQNMVYDTAQAALAKAKEGSLPRQQKTP